MRRKSLKVTCRTLSIRRLKHKAITQQKIHHRADNNGNTVRNEFRLLRHVVRRQAGGGEVVERGFVVVHDLVVELREVLRRGVVEDAAAETGEVSRHARAAGVVVSSDLEEVRVVFALGIVLLGTVERAEGHALHQVEAEGFLRRNGLGQTVELGLRALEAVGPETLPAQDLGISEKNAPEGAEVAAGNLLGGGAEELG